MNVDIREHRRRWEEAAPGIPYGYCQCGCGTKTTIAGHTDRTNRRVKGEPSTFRPGHSTRKYGAARWPTEDYLVEDRGHGTPCWIWQRAMYGSGYGKKYLEGRKYIAAHRWYFERAHGPLPDGLQPDHLCQQHACVNPEHMEAVTSAENTRRGKAAKLKPWQVRAIRRATEEVGLTYSVLARAFNVTPSAISDIINRRTWKDLV